MDTKKLRQKILDLAIHGKLVPQDPNDEPASVLLERIKAEKERLIKEGKIKKSKKSVKTSDTPHYPYLLPKGWEWSKLETFINEATDFVASGSFASLRENVKYYDEPEYAVLVRTKDFQSNFTKDLVYTDKQGYEFLSNSNLFGGELILPNIGASIGKVFIVPNLQERMTLAPNSIMIRCYKDTHKEWLQYLFLSPFGQEQLRIISSSTAQGKFNKTDLRTLNIPIPPLAEQERIVTEIKRWFTLIDEIEQSKFDLQNIISQAKSKILDLAIHGKLVPQDPNDEPAIELLKRINSHFTPCDNGHYPQLPDGWCVVSLKDLCENINGLWKGKKEPFVNVGVIRNANFTKDFKLDYSNIEYIDVEQRTFAKRHLENGDLIVEKSGGSDNNPVGRTILYEGKSGVLSFSNFTMALRTRNSDIVLSKFLYYYILAKYQKGDMRLMQTQTTGLRNLILDKFLSIPIHLPPLSEQKRIIDRIETIFTSLDMIMGSL